ncbi:hypothetical protein P3X46_010434 [Hevea brasiliensis]|uniref:DUF4220 domain-containing protein n=2 Tax=Hevea brasiliensis TaxID=3981 RepID=A0ABQ9MGP2_HEVBR|nr:uncharacterized protein LOC110661293 isoform X1 [Hevea brasiliensis]XP_021675580.2 uncharacterized protein LOC110661293 isoform X1 [Hevea brasiliensis]XP_058004486.1 uncharacterized protein LOC110661293 isoform X1 [Hevea brasiliensis]XP_058004487.1 uncharacterized protein LOC110661293 isoform X1 [Hevea brasiliensis]XP_058004488.1 uncharacterized protein LOC110661293 isoform X1 [Hevea brasiliensis]KAJ9178558.1 hypothetical protein P3X46_010434 [Hevea brasiliensis]
MLSTVVSSLIFINHRGLIEIIPESIRNLWNEWELRGAVMVSLSIQMVLIVLGNRRKYIARDWLAIVLWLVYLSADWIVNVSLGVLSNMESTNKNGLLDPKYVIMSFWAPFLLLHLGGPDTITAYSMEDNELWMRQLLGLTVKFGGAFYVLLRSWMGSPFNFLALPMFIVAIIKCGERTWALRFASTDQFRKSMLPRPDPGHSYAKFMDYYASLIAEGNNVSLEPVIDEASIVLGQSCKAVENSIVPDAAILHDAAYCFKTFKRLFADLILSYQDLKSSRSLFHDEHMTWEKAFKVIEIELGFMYNLLYTKAIVIHDYRGSFLRTISLSSTIFALIAFFIIDKPSYSRIDKIITCVLLFAAIALQVYEMIVLLSSDLTLLWLSKHKNLLVDLIYKTICYIQSWLQPFYITPSVNKRWSNCIAKFNLIRICLDDKPIMFSGIFRFLCIYEMLEKRHFKVLDAVSPDLKKLVFEQLLVKSRNELDISISRQLCAQRGDQVLREMGCFDKIGWSVKAEFDQSILLWHIATDLCFYLDVNKKSNVIETPICKESKSLAEYMLYLLVMCPFMLPKGIGQIRFQDTCAEATQFFQEKKDISDENKACTALLEVNTDFPPSQVKGDRSKSVLFDASKLAKFLQSLETEEQWTSEKKWEMINRVWIEMLSYAANQCGSNNHAKQLTGGGELLTHVWLLMAHLGITEQFQISKGNARVKLVGS